MRREFDVTPFRAYQGNGFFVPRVIAAAVQGILEVANERAGGRVILSSLRIERGAITLAITWDGGEGAIIGDGERVLMNIADVARTHGRRHAREAGWRVDEINGWPALGPYKEGESECES